MTHCSSHGFFHNKRDQDRGVGTISEPLGHLTALPDHEPHTAEGHSALKLLQGLMVALVKELCSQPGYTVVSFFQGPVRMFPVPSVPNGRPSRTSSWSSPFWLGPPKGRDCVLRSISKWAGPGDSREGQP